MRRFVALFETLDATTATNAKVEALRSYFAAAPPADAAWAVYFLTGRRLKHLIGPVRLKRWLIEQTGLPAWLVDASHQHVGDLAETIALLQADPAAPVPPQSLAEWVEGRLLPLAAQAEADQAIQLTAWWQTLPPTACLLVNKLLTGALRVGVSQTLVERALAEVAGLPRPVIAHRLMGDWQPDSDFYRVLLDPDATTADQARPYPFFLCHPLTTPPASLGPRDDWQVEWKWDGIRAQLVRREADIALWSRGEALITERFPEVVEAAGTLPAGVVLDGELLAWQDEVLPFAALQRRLGRKTLTPRLLREVPVILLAYDLLEQAGEDIRPLPLQVRRARLADLLTDAPPALRLSPRIEAPDWPALAKLREQSRARRVEGFMLKRHDSPYRAGRRKGEWWKWKIAPHTLDAVLTHAQPGAGRRSNLYTDYTFAVWDEQDRLVPIAKAYSGLTDMEIAELDAWIRQHTRERFGPVRAVEPQLVFELAFEGLAPSRRHKSGIAVRFPRILRWRRDLDAQDADRLADIRQLIGT